MTESVMVDFFSVRIEQYDFLYFLNTKFKLYDFQRLYFPSNAIFLEFQVGLNLCL